MLTFSPHFRILYKVQEDAWIVWCFVHLPWMLDSHATPDMISTRILQRQIIDKNCLLWCVFNRWRWRLQWFVVKSLNICYTRNKCTTCDDYTSCNEQSNTHCGENWELDFLKKKITCCHVMTESAMWYSFSVRRLRLSFENGQSWRIISLRKNRAGL